MKAGGAVHAVAIEQRQRRIAEIGGAIDEGLGQRRALQKAEGGRGVELDVGRTQRKLITTEDAEVAEVIRLTAVRPSVSSASSVVR